MHNRVYRDRSVQILKGVFKSIASMRGGVVKDTLVGYYPKLAKMMDNTLTRIIKDTSEQRRSALSENQLNQFYTAFAPIESEYLGSVDGRISTLANTAFPGSSRSMPSQVDVQSLVARIHEEVKDAESGGDRLLNLAVGVVGNALLFVATRADKMAADSGLVSKLSNACNPSQERNISLCKNLEEIQRFMLSLSTKLPMKAIKMLEGPMEKMQAVSYNMLLPIFKSQAEDIESAIQGIHTMNFAAEEGSESEVTEASSYVQAINSKLKLFRQEIMSKCLLNPGALEIPTIAQYLACWMTCRISTTWMRHVSLIRPITTPGKLQLAKDAADLEGILEQYLSGLHPKGKSQLSKTFAQYKSFKKLIFVSRISDVSANIRETLPLPIILQYLFALCPDEIDSPYARNKLTKAQYTTWLDNQSEGEVLKLIKTTLNQGKKKLSIENSMVDGMISLIDSKAES